MHSIIHHHLHRLLRSVALAIDRAALAINMPAPVIAAPAPSVSDQLQACLEREAQRQAALAAMCAKLQERIDTAMAEIAANQAQLARMEAERLEQLAEAERKAREIVWQDHPDTDRNDRLGEAARAEWLRGAS